MVSRKQGASRGSRTGIEKRRAAIRGDKDGDVSMDTASRAKGGITKRTSTGNPEANARRGRSNVNGAARLKAEVMRAVKSGDVATKGRGGPSQQQLEDIVITGWTDLLTSSDESSLVPAIVTFVERKATLKSPTKRPVKVKKVRQLPSTLGLLGSAFEHGRLSYPIKMSTTTLLDQAATIAFG